MSGELISIVIPNYNGIALLRECLASLKAQALEGFAQEIIVVDNASADSSAKMVRKEFPDSRLIELPDNIGYTLAVNRGLQAASGTLILLLNNDTVMQPGSLQILAARLAEGPADIGGVQPLLVWAGNPGIIDSTGIALSAHFRARDDLHGAPVSQAPNRNSEIWGTCAACSLIRRDVIDRAGPLDPDFFAEWDDVDFCLRARWYGYRFLLVPDALVWHHRSPTSRRDPIAKIARHRRNQLLTFTKSLPQGLAGRCLLHRFWRDVTLIPHYLKRGELGATVSAWREYLRLRPQMKQRRRALLESAALTQREMRAQLKLFMKAGTRA